MRILIFLTTVWLVALFCPAEAQDAAVTQERYWLLPDHAKFQYAGSMGMFSLGGGYKLFKKRSDLDVYAGLLPKRSGHDNVLIATLKFTHRVWKIDRLPDWELVPLTAGFYITYSFGSEFSTDLPDHYPSKYYWWSEAVRPNIFIGSRVAKKLKHSKTIESVGMYFDLGTNELKLVSYIQNTDYLAVWDILHGGVGITMTFKE